MGIHNPPVVAIPTPYSVAEYWWGFLDIAGDGTPTATKLESTLGEFAWSKFQTGILRGVPDIGRLPDKDKVWLTTNTLISTAVPTTLNWALIEIVNAPRVIQVTTFAEVSGVIAVSNLPTARIYVLIQNWGHVS